MSFLPTKQELAKWHQKTDYIVQCETCNLEFFNQPLEVMNQLLFGSKKSSWNPRTQKWYIATARHWIEHQDHTIVAKLVNPEKQVDQEFFNLSADWHKGLLLEPDQSKTAMLNELKGLEDGIIVV